MAAEIILHDAKVAIVVMRGTRARWQFNRQPGSRGPNTRPGGQQGRPSYGGQGSRPPYGGGQAGGRPQGGPRFGTGFKPGFGAAPAPMEENKKVPAKKTFKAKRPIYNRRDKEENISDKLFGQKKKQSVKTNPIPESIEIMETISVSDLAKKMNLKASELIAKLMSMGMMVSIRSLLTRYSYLTCL